MAMLFFCFHDTATTDIYTYLHTLSLHDSLPISDGRTARGRDAQVADSAGGRHRVHGDARAGLRVRSARHAARRPFCTHRRSEEHTSELQSLMRISYAVFCLNKKRIQRTNI